MSAQNFRRLATSLIWLDPNCIDFRVNARKVLLECLMQFIENDIDLFRPSASSLRQMPYFALDEV